MAYIGAYQITAFRGRMRRAVQRVAMLDPNPGLDGSAVVKSGWSAEPVIIESALDVATGAAGARALVEAYRALHGQVITVIDQFGETWRNVTVLSVTTDYSATVVASTYRVEATWRLLPESTRP